ncbi:redoxin family protein [Thiobacillus sp.]|jgi:hypothetical protein|uniref:TlpA family protein disulfide reductase n=1 Tax=Thiobacillus sp. TaxID=924 RepID=UPI0025F0BC6D|nr:redoxin family protein [Thiobacillus sp.]
MKSKATTVSGGLEKRRVVSALCTAGPALFALGLLAIPVSAVLADGKDGTFPSAEQVGGEVFIKPMAVGTKMPTDIEIYDSNAKKADLGSLVAGKRTLVVFFISAVPVSVAQLKKTEEFVDKYGRGANVVFVNADTMGTHLMGGPTQAIPSTAATMRLIKKEHNLKRDMYVAPNDVLSPKGVSTRLGIRGLPTSFLLSANGTIEKVFVGPQDWKKGDI